MTSSKLVVCHPTNKRGNLWPNRCINNNNRFLCNVKYNMLNIFWVSNLMDFNIVVQSIVQHSFNYDRIQFLCKFTTSPLLVYCCTLALLLNCRQQFVALFVSKFEFKNGSVLAFLFHIIGGQTYANECDKNSYTVHNALFCKNCLALLKFVLQSVQLAFFQHNSRTKNHESQITGKHSRIQLDLNYFTIFSVLYLIQFKYTVLRDEEKNPKSIAVNNLRCVICSIRAKPFTSV